MAEPTEGLRERTRRAVQAEIGDVAMRLFLDQGFEATTIDQIAAESGISPRSFFRYFGTKEDVVLGNLAQSGILLRDALVVRPAEEDSWTALRAAFQILISASGSSRETSLQISRMLLETPSLRARHLEKQLQWQELLVPEIESRLLNRASYGADPRAHAIVASALACLDAATVAWTLNGGTGTIGEFLDASISAVRQ